MTVRAIAGLVALNLFFAVVGAGVLWGLRGWRVWTEFLRLAGVAYLLGVGSLVVLLSVELVIGIPVRAVTILVSGLVMVGAGIVAGRVQRRPPPRLRDPQSRFPRLTLFGAVFAAGILVYLEAAFRGGRLEWLWEWDAWRVWTRVAEGIYFAGEVDPDLAGTLAAYPPGLSVLQAAAFHAMGSADVVTLHLQPWFLLVGFLAAVVGLLATRVRQSVLLPVLLLLLVMPSFTERITWALADLPLDYFLAVAAVLLALWLQERRDWQLAAATLLFGAALLMKREALLLVACVLLAVLVATVRERRSLWPRIALAAAAALAMVIPWRVWIVLNGIPSDGPTGGYLGFLDDLDRAWPSLEFVVRALFDYGLWILVPVVAVASIVLGLISPTRRHAIFAGSFLVSAVLASWWIVWADPALPLDRTDSGGAVIRLVGAIVIVLGVLTPLLLEQALAFGRTADIRLPSWRPALPRFVVGVVPWVIVLAAILVYPGSMAVGYSGLRLPGGSPPFPTVEQCVREPVDGSPVRVVLGYEGSYAEASALRGRAREAGLGRAAIEQDGCGRLRVFVGDLESSQAAEELAARAREDGLDATLERAD